jgi:hypothetical protein
LCRRSGDCGALHRGIVDFLGLCVFLKKEDALFIRVFAGIFLFLRVIEPLDNLRQTDKMSSHIG